jgi:hypothetical protein
VANETTHCDVTTLSLIALGEQPTPQEAIHLVTCDTCRRQWESLRSTVDIARDTDPADLISPPDHVWAAIAEEIASSDADTTVVGMRRRFRITPWIAVAAAAGLVLGGVGGAALMRSTESTPTLVATAPLEPLEGYAATGTARIERMNGAEMLAVDVSALPQTDGYYEVWLLAPDASSMIAVGTLGAGDTGVFPLPPGVSLADYPVVDISAEPYDGDPTHSADSIVRGTLPV